MNGQTEREGRPSGRDAPGHRYEFRTYRNRIAPEGNLAAFSVCVRETDLFLRADRDLSHETLETVHACRAQIETAQAIGSRSQEVTKSSHCSSLPLCRCATCDAVSQFGDRQFVRVATVQTPPRLT